VISTIYIKRVIELLGEFVLFLSEAFRVFRRLWRRRDLFIRQCEFIGVSSTGILLVAGLFLGGFAYLGWRWLQNPGSMGIWGYSLYLPAAAVLLFVLWFVILHLSSGGRWN
jgi:ABC-type transporter Mla maintaining outer membrane lipid asymmetry permease subunit MlaE